MHIHTYMLFFLKPQALEATGFLKTRIFGRFEG